MHTPKRLVRKSRLNVPGQSGTARTSGGADGTLRFRYGTLFTTETLQYECNSATYLEIMPLPENQVSNMARRMTTVNRENQRVNFQPGICVTRLGNEIG